MILNCSCVNKGQDAIHGGNKRVHNPTQKGGKTGTPVYRCTGCSKERTAGEARLMFKDTSVAASPSAKKRRSAKQIRSVSKRH